MKSRVHNNISGAKDMGTYLELPLKQFLIQMPQYAESVLRFSLADANDESYIVRFCLDKNGLLKDVEVGYPEDNWYIH